MPLTKRSATRGEARRGGVGGRCRTVQCKQQKSGGNKGKGHMR